MYAHSQIVGDVVEVIGHAEPDAVIPSGAPLGKLLGRKATILRESDVYHDSVVVQIDGVEYTLHDTNLSGWQKEAP